MDSLAQVVNKDNTDSNTSKNILGLGRALIR